MPYLRNTWYAAAWGTELRERMLARTILDEPIVLFRKTDRAVVALQDRCAHRFVPLHLGRLENDIVECKYHGLRYNETGTCIFNPHGDGRIPPGARVKNYTVIERFGIIWIWMGDSARADPDSALLTPETLTSTHYFWGMARNFRLDDESFSEQLLVTGMTVFNSEDEPVIEAQQCAMGASDELFGMKPALLQTDRAAVRARRLLERMIQHERGEEVEPSAKDSGIPIPLRSD